MTDDPASGLDPRFDPRYQRGYSGRETDAVPVAPAEKPIADPRDPVPVPVTAAETVAAPVPVPEPAAPAPTAGATSDPDPLPVSVETREDSDVFAPEPGASGPSVRAWLIAGWAVTAAVFAAGALLSWIVSSDIGYSTGSFSNEDQWLRELGWTLAPSLLTAGAMGVVVVTAVAALMPTRGDDAATEGGGPRFGRGAAWWALVGIAAVAVIGVVWAIGRVFEGSNANGSLMLDGNGNPADVADQAEVFARIELGQFAQSLVGSLALAAIAAFVALVAVEVRRATLTAARARSAPPDRP
ncbi:hypothetical protein ASD23_03465 [Agromyces sp. Root1464]|uniref:hypothetical protein n=1 Tax=Agromyces sp. Root1464 TaxID=1736467 RepID=UPI0007018B72|nr:hypothetical protein [Agromyces sp. Root1464]KQZ11165.1 hypothetical protein ASD23_03465 [Agromyces sp. Root1464]